jgi:hypothetical protein
LIADLNNQRYKSLLNYRRALSNSMSQRRVLWW